MEYAVIETGGKQYKVTPGLILEVESLSAQSGADLTLDKVLLYVSESKTSVGSPYVSGVSVSAKVLNGAKGDKIRVAHFLAKSRHRRVKGHRQTLTRLQIGEIFAKNKPGAVSKDAKVKLSVPKKTIKTRKTVEKSTKKA